MTDMRKRALVLLAALLSLAVLVVIVMGRPASTPIAQTSPSPEASAEVSPSPSVDSSPSPSSVASSAPQYRLTVVLTGATNGHVVSTPAGIDCPTNCSATFPKGTKVTLTPMAGPPPTGYDLTWMEWAESCPGAGTTCEATMRSDQTFHATFRLRPSSFALSLTIIGSGGLVTSVPSGINCGEICTANFPAGPVTLTAAAAVGYVFSGWSGACSGTGSCVVTLGADRDVPPVEVSATFTAVTPP